MLQKILEHMNNEHKDILPLYVKYYLKRDVENVKLINVDEEKMTLLLNYNEKININFTKKIDLKDVHLEMVKMAKIVRKALGVNAPEHYKEKGHQEEEKNKMEISDFIGSFQSVIIATISQDNEPNIGYAPFFRYQGDNFLYINETEKYFNNLKNNGKLDVLFIQDENDAIMPSMRKRVTYKSNIEFLEKNEYYNEVLDEFQKNDMAIQMTRNFPMFYLVKINFICGRYVKGPRQAFDITKDRRIVEITLGGNSQANLKLENIKNPKDEKLKEQQKLEEEGNFEKRYKSHHDASSIVTNHFRKDKKMVTENEVLEKLNKPSSQESGVIYVHIPYCDKICSFCNLNRKQLDNDLEEYTNFLVEEFEKYGKTEYMKSKKIEVIFFGGGTPTILKEHQLEKILQSIHKNYKISKDCEFTFETTLHNLNKNKIKVLEKYGVNRLSVGIQSFAKRGRDVLNRTFTKEETIKRLKDLKQSFNGLVCIDIIYNYPNQTVEEVIEDANIVIDLKIDSVSFYSLMIHEGSQMSKDIKENTLELNYELKKDKELHDVFLHKLLDSGEYEVLEHTKIVRKGKDKYKYIRYTHQGIDILPIGVGAGGKLNDIEMFRMNQERVFYVIGGNEDEKRLKKISGLFQYPKVYFSDLKKYISEEIFEELIEIFKNYEKKGYMKIYETYTELTKEGIFWGNNIGSVVLKKCLGGTNAKSGGFFHIDGKHGKNS